MARWRQEQLSSRQIFIYLMMAAILCLLIPSRFTNKLDHLLSWLISPFSKTSRQPLIAFDQALRQSNRPNISAREYQQLLERSELERTELINLQEQVKYLKDLTTRLTGLRQQYGLERAQLILAQVTGSDTSNMRDIKKLDRGAGDLLERGQLVLSWTRKGRDKLDIHTPEELYQTVLQGAIVGKINDAGDGTASLQLLSDPGFGMKVWVAPSPSRKEKHPPAEGLLRGKGMGRIVVEKIPVAKEYPIQPGDMVLARPEAEKLPVAMLIGWVQSCRRGEDNPVLWDIRVTPAVELHTLREVVVIKNTF